MLFAVDIDQTIAGANALQVYAALFNRDFALGIDEASIASIGSYQQFIDLPQVQALRRSGDYEGMWRDVRRRAIALPEIVRHLTPLPGAAKGVQRLTGFGAVRYYSARPEAVIAETRRWLERYDFPLHDVVCCASIDAKLVALSHWPRDESIVLIDDRAHASILSALQVAERDVVLGLGQRLHLLAFGAQADTLPASFFSLTALPSWDKITEVLVSLL